MTEKDNIKELFSEGLKHYQAPVDPALWSAVSGVVSGVVSSGVAKTTISLITKIAIAVIITSTVVGSYFYFQSPDFSKQPTALTIDKGKTNIEANDLEKSKDDSKSTSPEQFNTIETTLNPINSTQVLNNSDLDQINTSDEIVVEQELVTESPILLPPYERESVASNSQQSLYNSISRQIDITTLSFPQNSTTTAIEPAFSQTNIVLPNIFTPNNDGQNDVLEIDWRGADVSDFSLVVLDSKNSVVYSNDNPNFRWDGVSLGGELLERGAYIYFVTAVLNDQKWQQSSSLQIQY